MFGTVRCAENYGYLIMVILQGFGGFIIVVICPGLCPGTCTLRGDASPPKKQTSESHAHYYLTHTCKASGQVIVPPRLAVDQTQVGGPAA